jgi:hypothetical protein
MHINIQEFVICKNTFFFEQIACAIINITNSPEAYNLKIRDKTPHSLS